MRFDHCALQECGVARFLSLLDGPWATLIVRELLKKPHRFNELLSALPGISAHTLSSRLRKFEAHELVTRTAYAEIPPRVVCELTPVGMQLRPVLDAMNAWAMTVPPRLFGLDEAQAPPVTAD
jgi:DNA-binding HxlR family transcriptional regulator